MKNKKFIYVAHQIAGDVDANVKAILAIIRHINLTQPDVVALAPYIVDVLAMDDATPSERAIGLAKNHALIRAGVFDEIWLFGTGISSGIADEISIFKEIGLPVIPKTEGTVRF